MCLSYISTRRYARSSQQSITRWWQNGERPCFPVGKTPLCTTSTVLEWKYHNWKVHVNRFRFKNFLYNCNFKPYVSYNHTLHSSSGNTDQFTEAWTLLQTSLTIIDHFIKSDCELVDVYGDSLCRLLTLHVYHYLSSVSKIFRVWSVYVRFHLDVVVHRNQPFWKAHISHLDMCRTMAFSLERNPYIQFINGVAANFDLCCLRFRRIISISSIFQNPAKDN